MKKNTINAQLLSFAHAGAGTPKPARATIFLLSVDSQVATRHVEDGDATRRTRNAQQHVDVLPSERGGIALDSPHSDAMQWYGGRLFQPACGVGWCPALDASFRGIINRLHQNNRI
jgi:hypothetical protein